MAESLEPKQSLGPKVAAAFLWVLAIAGGGYLLLFYEAPDTTDILSPGQVRKVVAKLRDHQAERLALQVKQMRQMRAEMQKIRDKWAGEAQIDRPLDEVLEQSELEARQSAEAELAEKELIGVYDVGRAVEQDMITIYREFLAARTVGLRPGYSYEEAYEASMTPRPERPGLSQDVLYADITSTADDGGLPAFNEELRKSTIEMREMHENAKKLLAFTKKSSSSTNDGLSVDMSQDDMAMLGYIGPELLPDEIDLTHAPDVGNFAAIPGRRLTTGGDVDQWLYIDTWYIIGPFQGDRRRKNLDVRFGPEANVNLDDVFTGHNNRKIQWRFKKTGHVQQEGPKSAFWKIEPSTVEAYAIYYAFTEIYSDVEREVWIATGTDDYGKLWVNDKLVWRSPQDRKPYNATENIQTITLKQGQNKILYRVENAGGTMGFSLMIRLATQ